MLVDYGSIIWHHVQGYLAVTLLMHENSDFLRLVVNSIRKDLNDNNEIHNCLALHAIANVGGQEMAEALAEDVHRLLISPWANSSCKNVIRCLTYLSTSPTFVRKKAALTLLRLYRKHPEVIPAAEWALRIVSLMDDMDLVNYTSQNTNSISMTYVVIRELFSALRA